MIASFQHNFIFIKTRKTAGTTIEMTLAPLCGPDDIITPLSRQEELRRGNGTILCRNFSPDRALEERLRQAFEQGTDRKAIRAQLHPSVQFYNHINAVRAKSRLPADFWKAAFKFSVERHPYEKAVSLAYFLYGPRRTSASFEEYLDKIVRSGGYANHRYYCISGRLAVDEIIRQESLRDDLQRIGAKLGIAIPDELPRAKITSRKDRRPAREILSEMQKETIYRLCKLEFDLLGYEP